MEVKVDPEIVENIRRVAEVDIKNIKEEVKVDPEVMEKDLLQMDVVINNVTSTFQVGPDLRLELEGLVMRGINMQYRGGTSLTYKIRQPRATATIFSSGKVNLVECRSEEEARVASRKVGRAIQKLVARYPGEVCQGSSSQSHQQITVRDFQVRSVWASTQLPWDIRMEEFLGRNQTDKACQFNPESRQNVNYQIEEPRATVKIFSSGKLVIQAPALSNVHSAIRQLYPRLFPARKKRTEGKARGRVKDDGDKFWRNKK